MQMNIYTSYFILLLEYLSADVSKFKINTGIMKIVSCGFFCSDI